MRTRYIFAFMAAIMLTGCGDFLEEQSQDKAYVKTLNDLDELLLGSVYMPTGTPASIAYDYLDKPYYYPYVHLMSDELEQNIENVTNSTGLYDVADRFFGYYTFQQQVGINPTQTEINEDASDWNNIYKNINVANMVITKVSDVELTAEDNELKRNRIMGEAYFVRGALYFVLANLYGKPYNPSTANSDLAIPIKTTEYIEDKIFGRNTVAEVYAQAEKDLQTAESLLANTSRQSYYRANATACNLMLSRLYLYKQDFEKAIQYGKKVIDAGDNKLQDLNTVSSDFFLAPNMPEVIFTMGNGGLRHTVTGNIKDFGVSDFLVNLYEDGDLRTKYYITKNADTGFQEYVKGGVPADINRSSLSTVFLLRTAEAYLNVAEAAACINDVTTANNILNTLRAKRFDAADYSPVQLSGDELVEFIRNERARELCIEGHRYFDLKRYTVAAVCPSVKTIRHGYTTFQSGYVYDPSMGYVYKTYATQTQYYEVATDENGFTIPIPQEVIDFNTGMVNNNRPVRNVVETVNY